MFNNILHVVSQMIFQKNKVAPRVQTWSNVGSPAGSTTMRVGLIFLCPSGHSVQSNYSTPIFTSTRLPLSIYLALFLLFICNILNRMQMWNFSGDRSKYFHYLIKKKRIIHEIEFLSETYPSVI